MYSIRPTGLNVHLIHSPPTETPRIMFDKYQGTLEPNQVDIRLAIKVTLLYPSLILFGCKENSGQQNLE